MPTCVCCNKVIQYYAHIRTLTKFQEIHQSSVFLCNECFISSGECAHLQKERLHLIIRGESKKIPLNIEAFRVEYSYLPVLIVTSQIDQGIASSSAAAKESSNKKQKICTAN